MHIMHSKPVGATTIALPQFSPFILMNQVYTSIVLLRPQLLAGLAQLLVALNIFSLEGRSVRLKPAL